MSAFTSARPYEIEITTEVLAGLARSGAALQHLHDNGQVDDEIMQVHEEFVRELITNHREEGHPAGLVEVALGADPYAGTIELSTATVNKYVQRLEIAQSEYPAFANPFAHMAEILTEWGGQPVASD